MALPLILMGVQGLGQLGLGAYNTWQQGQRAKEAKADYEGRLADWRAQDTSNLYANMQNPYEDATVNLQAANFTAQQTQQGLANTMSGLRGAAGSSGIAALAQSIAGQQAQAAQQASVSIGTQEQRNQAAAMGMESRLQTMERQGEGQSRALRAGMLQTELGMSMNELTAANQARQKAMSSAVQGLGMVAGYGLAGTQAGQNLMGKLGDLGTAAPQTAAPLAPTMNAPGQTQLQTNLLQAFQTQQSQSNPLNILQDNKDPYAGMSTEALAALEQYNKYFPHG